MSRNRNRRYFSGFKKSIWWREKRERLYMERGGVCEICGKKIGIELMSLHHVAPRSIGGRDIDGNLQLLCNGCHKALHKGYENMHAKEI